jgi:hypothetical protein
MGDQCVSGIIWFTEQIHDNGLKGTEVLDSLGGADGGIRKERKRCVNLIWMAMGPGQYTDADLMTR